MKTSDKSLRVFIALDLPPDLLQSITQTSRDLQKRLQSLPLRWSPPANTHLTLKFLGELQSSALPPVIDLLHACAGRTSPFDIQVAALGAFPNLARPRVLWLGVNAPDNLSVLQRSIEQGTAELGYPLERRSFSPHLTLARARESASQPAIRQIGEALRDLQVGVLGFAQMSSVQLYSSELRPGGSVYTLLHRATFGGPG